MLPIVLPVDTGDLTALGPLLAVLIAALGVLTVDMTFEREEARGRWSFIVGLVGAGLAAGCASLWQWEAPGRAILGGALYADAFSSFFDVLLATLLGLTLVVSWYCLDRVKVKPAEFTGLAVLSFSGMFLMVRAADMLTLFLAIELMSLPVYVLAGLSAGSKTGREAALKYFVLGSLASAILLYGMALVYGVTASLGYTDIAGYLATASRESGVENPLFLAGLALMLVGLGFKVAAAPFHMWTPDVYEGAPTPVTTLMASGVRAAAAAALLRFLAGAVLLTRGHWMMLVWALAALSMIAGNVGALAQTNVKRLLAYSGIAHAGYMLLGLFALPRGAGGFSMYVAVYALSVLGAFGALQWFDDRGRETVDIEDLAGAGKRHPWMASVMTVFLLSLAGIPPTAGFAAKWFVFAAAVQAGYVGLALLGVMTSLFGAYYYLRVVIAMWMDEPADISGADQSPTTGLVLGLLALAVLFIGCFPGWLWFLADLASSKLV
ncbi:MAG: NADH-quinone oxidoreductase subunit N [Candidatus Wallbacteria bacterium]|nr:NADH-quinone oxidoreductase subunit N [Candidatus Wallbacteria bacterium]